MPCLMNKKKSMIASTQYSILCNVGKMRNEMSNIDKDSALTTHGAQIVLMDYIHDC